MSLSKSVEYGWRFYLHMLTYVPIQTKALTAASLTFFANVITQKVFEKQAQMDYKRALKFVAFSLILTPISHYWYRYLDTLFKKDSKEENKGGADLTPVKKMLVDELIYDPFCIVFFFSVIGLFEGKSSSSILEKIKQDYWSTQKMSWKVWPLFQLFNFMFIPGNLRILFVNLVSFFWSIFMQLQAANQLKKSQ